MGKRSRSVRMKTTPVAAGAGRMRMLTGTPECRPTPETSTGRCTVVSNRNVFLRHLKLLLEQSRNATDNYLMRKDLSRLQCGQTATLCARFVAKSQRYAA